MPDNQQFYDLFTEVYMDHYRGGNSLDPEDNQERHYEAQREAIDAVLAKQLEDLRVYVVDVPLREDGVYLFLNTEDANEFAELVGNLGYYTESLIDREVARHFINTEKEDQDAEG